MEKNQSTHSILFRYSLLYDGNIVHTVLAKMLIFDLQSWKKWQYLVNLFTVYVITLIFSLHFYSLSHNGNMYFLVLLNQTPIHAARRRANILWENALYAALFRKFTIYGRACSYKSHRSI